jgi:hypothetical protein
MTTNTKTKLLNFLNKHNIEYEFNLEIQELYVDITITNG